jgi:signal peptidase I
MRWKLFWEKIRGRADLRSAMKSGAWSFFTVLAVGLILKIFVLDSVKITGAQMEPAIQSGDRLLLFKLPYIMPLVRNSFIRHDKPIVAALPHGGARTLLRIAAISGDTVSITGGQFYRNTWPVEQFHKNTDSLGVIPAAYSPVDYMERFRIPAPRDSVIFSELTLRDLIFAYSMLRQEKSNVSLRAFVVENGVVNGDYAVKDFAFYSGPIDAIPEEMTVDWFFWDRLQKYLSMTAGEGEGPRLAFSIFRGKNEITGFRVAKQYVFLMGDNWCGALDSRYFGPVASTNIKGRPFMTLWGTKINEISGKRTFDGKRVFRRVR